MFTASPQTVIFGSLVVVNNISPKHFNVVQYIVKQTSSTKYSSITRQQNKTIFNLIGFFQANAKATSCDAILNHYTLLYDAIQFSSEEIIASQDT